MRSILSSSTVSSLSEGRKQPTKPSVRVVSYNVLSSHLADPSWFWTCKPEHLEASFRLEKIKMKLKAEIDQESIICLQEVSLCWSGAFHQFFSENNYHFITALYGSGFTGYMGVAIAVPLHKYHIKEVAIRRLSETMTVSNISSSSSALPIPVETRTPPVSWWQTIYTRLQTAVSYFYPTTNRPLLSFRREQSSSPPFSSSFSSSYNIWEMISSKTNQMICCRLSLRGEGQREELVVGTYHMPCHFECPPVMVAHSALAAQFIQSFSSTTPFVLAGDFNCKPTSPEYKLLTTGRLDEKDEETFPSLALFSSEEEKDKQNNSNTNNNNNNNSGWSPSLLLPLKSAYFTHLGKEPDFTNFAQTSGRGGQSEEPFQETIDYLFHSDVLEVVDVLSLPTRGGEEGVAEKEGEGVKNNYNKSYSSSSSFPNEEQPSDHLMIAATFCFPGH
jgi:2',5'-phosphodiesterase